VASAIQLPKETHPGLVYFVARLAALTGDSTRALSLLKNAFESVPPSRLESFKADAKECPDFAALAAGSEFSRVLETRSLVQESGCSGGSNCANCPMRGKCPKSQPQVP
jgi:hypothetical protein